MPSARDIIDALALSPHPEGGWFKETYRQCPDGGGRGASTAIYYLLEAGDRSHWHKVSDADEVWHWYAGAPLRLSISPEGSEVSAHTLGPDVQDGMRPQLVVPADQWQSAESLGAWTLVGCTVSPAFEFDRFVLAPPGWEPGV